MVEEVTPTTDEQPTQKGVSAYESLLEMQQKQNAQLLEESKIVPQAILAETQHKLDTFISLKDDVVSQV